MKVILSVMISLLIISVSLMPNGKSDGWQYAETTVLKAVSDYQKGAWVDIDADTVLWNDTLVSDGDTDYVYTTTAWSVLQFDMTTFVDNASLSSETYEVILWVVAKGQMAGAGRLYMSLRNDASSIYDASLMTKRNTGNAYTNFTLRTNGCPWTGLNWTVTTINQIYASFWTNGVGYQRITQVGIIVNTIIPLVESVAPDNTNALILIVIIAVLVCVMIPLGVVRNDNRKNR